MKSPEQSTLRVSFEEITRPIAAEMDAAEAVIEVQVAADQGGRADMGRTALGIVMATDPDSGLTMRVYGCANCTNCDRTSRCPTCLCQCVQE